MERGKEREKEKERAHKRAGFWCRMAISPFSTEEQRRKDLEHQGFLINLNPKDSTLQEA